MIEFKEKIRPVICVVGARPNFMKMAPILRSFSTLFAEVPVLLVHTGQHYDKDMNDRLFDDLKLPIPDINLGVGSGSHAVQTAEVMRKFEPVIDNHDPSCIVVVGDVNSTLACALVAVKKGVPVVHVEAGLRSNDRAMPEEINRILTDQLSDKLYLTERSAELNLVREGINLNKIIFTGNVMIDSVVYNKKFSKNVNDILISEGISEENIKKLDRFALVTLHRPSNVDQIEVLRDLLQTLSELAKEIPLIFALHPRTKANIEKYELANLINLDRMFLLPPQGYLEMLGLISSSNFVLTDSGGLQEETTALGIPCLTLRENTERPITIEQGTNTLVGISREKILFESNQILNGLGKKGHIPEYWDGKASDRIVADIKSWLKIN